MSEVTCPDCGGAMLAEETEYGGHFEPSECIAALRVKLAAETKRADDNRDLLGEVEKQRDAARDKADAWEKTATERHDYWSETAKMFQEALARAVKAEAERDSLRAQVETAADNCVIACNERDSARARLATETARSDSAHADRLLAVTEADEMREEIKRLEQEALARAAAFNESLADQSVTIDEHAAEASALRARVEALESELNLAWKATKIEGCVRGFGVSLQEVIEQRDERSRETQQELSRCQGIIQQIHVALAAPPRQPQSSSKIHPNGAENLDEPPRQPQAQGNDGKCKVCRGHGADPMSDNTNWLPCGSCGGTGKKRAPASPERDKKEPTDGVR